MTHFHQFDQPFGIHARDAFLARLGFTNVDFGKKGKTVHYSQPATVPATIVARAANPYGRPIAYVIRGRAAGSSGAELDPAVMRQSVSYAMVADGEAYPMFNTRKQRALIPQTRVPRARLRTAWRLLSHRDNFVGRLDNDGGT